MENLLQFAERTQRELDSVEAKDFAKLFVSKKSEYWHKYSNGRINSGSHGIDFFKNVINYWKDPIGYYKQFNPKFDGTQKIAKEKDDYEYQFFLILKENEAFGKTY
jgi:hypothetical protein